LSKKQIEKIITLRKEKTAFEEIAKQVDCSVSSAKKYWYEYARQHPAEKDENEKESNLEIVVKKNSEMIHMILELLSGSEVGFLIQTLGFNMDSEGASNDATLAMADIETEFYGKLLELDRDYAMQLLRKNKPWETWIPGLNDKAVDDNREKWLEFLGKRLPEFLVEVIDYYKKYE
jgi:hypothetical protein